jgi:CheY-like chemotaxis protein
MRVLFVDPDTEHLEASRRWMSLYSTGTWEIHTAASAAQALAVLQEHLINLVALEVHLPMVDGLQFLRLLSKKYPEVVKVVVTGESSDTFRASCLDEGAELFLEKPREEQGWQALYATLVELNKLKPSEDGFRGVLRKVGLHDVLQLECLAGNSSVLELSTDADQGVIYIQGGKIVHARSGTLRGIDAFFHLFTLTGGEFILKPYTTPPQIDIIGHSWETLLLEAARARDERSRAPQSKPALPRPISPIRRIAPPVSTEDHRPQVSEILICSPEGDVIYEWNCPNPHGRISLFEFLLHNPENASISVGLGKFDRLEAEDGPVRFVARIQPEHAMMVVTRLVPALDISEEPS